MAEPDRCRVVTFGMSERADYRVRDARAAFPERLSLSLVWAGGELELKTRFVADYFWLPVAAAVTTALELGVEPDVVAARVASFEPLATRCGVLEVPGGPTFIMDCAKAPLHSLSMTFGMLKDAAASRKILVVGQISDYQATSKKIYRDAYVAARAVADKTVFVGDRAHRARAPQEDHENGRHAEFLSVKEAAEHVRAMAQPGDLVLLKGSTTLHLERVAIATKTEVRCWEQQCGYWLNCFECGKYHLPFEEHRGKRRKRR